MKKSFLLLLATTAVGFLGCKPVGELLSDFSPPTGPGISINGGDALTNSTSVTLSLQAVDAEQMYISNSVNCSGAGNWEAFSSSKSWTLGSTNSTATVSVKYRDKAQNVSACVSDTIVHDGVGPVLTSVSVTPTSPSANTTPQANFTLSEAATVTLHNGASCNSALSSSTSKNSGAQTLIANPALVANATYAIYAKAVDSAGNSSCTSIGNYIFDTASPTVGSVISFASVGATSLTVNWGAATDTVTTAAQLQYKLVRASNLADIDEIAKVDAITTPEAGLEMNWTAGTITKSVTGLTNSTTYFFAVLVRDVAGNKALYAPQSQITLDATAPVAGAAITINPTSVTPSGDGLTVNWGAASDNLTSEANLEYRLVRAENSTAIDELEEVQNTVQAGVTIVMDYNAGVGTTTEVVTGLTANTQYFFAVVVRDAAGNKAFYSPVGQVTDINPPTVGTGINFSSTIDEATTVNWGAASDTVTTNAALLQYKLVRASTAALIDSVDEADSITGNALVMDWTANTTTKVAMGLSPATTYFFAVLVKDEVGNKNIYAPQSETTLADTPPSGTLSITGTTGVGDYTSSSLVDLTVSATGATEMCITNSSGDTCDGASPGPSDPAWEVYNPSSPTLTGWLINTASNVETVYVRYRDIAGNIVLASNTIRRVPEVSLVTAVKLPGDTEANGSYNLGDQIKVRVKFNTGISVTGSPYITLATGYSSGGNNRANCSATPSITGLTDDTLDCTYTVAAGHSSGDLNYTSTGSLVLNGGTIKVKSGSTNALLALPALSDPNSLAGQKNIVINTAPTITSVTSSTANGTYGVGAVIPIRVNFNQNVNVTGTPQLTLETGHNDAIVNCPAVSGTSTLVCNYTVAAAQHSTDLNYLSTSSLAPNGGNIMSAVGTPVAAILTLPALSGGSSLADNKNLVIETSPQVVGVTTTTGDGPFRKNGEVSISIQFTGPVTVTPTGMLNPYLELQTNSSPLARAAYSSGSGNNTLVFLYTVALGESSSDLDYVDVNSLKANDGVNGTIKSGAQDATLTLVAPGAAGSISDNQQVVVDPFPEVASVTSSSSNGLYDVGSTVAVQVVFTEPVDVTGAPQLTLETGATDAVVDYDSGNGTNTLVFNYTVAYGETSIGPNDSLSGRLEYTGISALALNGGTIVDADETEGNAFLDLPTPGAAGSLSDNKEIRTLLGKAVKGEDVTELTSDLGFGSAVAGAGDLDGNSRPEIIIGAPLKNDGANPNRGQVYVLTDTGSLLYTVTGSENNAGFGSAVAGGANVGSGGTAELDYLVGAPTASGGGKVFLYEGTTLLRTFTGAASGDQFGTSVALLGDLTGDGFSEVAVGAPGADEGGTNRGAVYIFDGASGNELVVIPGTTDNSGFGSAIANAGDVGGSVLNDLVIGAKTETTVNGAESGKVYVYTASYSSSTLDYTLHWSMNGEAAGDHLGTSVAKAGFVDAGSVSDIIVGAPDHDASKGRAYVLNGSSGAALHTVTGDAAGDKLGYSVAGLGDRTSDSKAEFIVGAPFAAGGGTARGIAKVFNGDTGAVIHTLTGANDDEHFGKVVAEVEGNIDGILNGPNGFIVAAPDFNTDEGRGHYYR